MLYKTILLKLIFITFFSDKCHHGVTGFTVLLSMKKAYRRNQANKAKPKGIKGTRIPLCSGQWIYSGLAIRLYSAKSLYIGAGEGIAGGAGSEGDLCADRQ